MHRRDPPDLILHNARIYTVDSRNSVAEAVAIAGDRIIRVGKDADVLALKVPSTRVLDMHGATIVPGFHDAHGHVVGLGASLQDVDLRGTSSYEEVVGRVRRRLANARPGEWIVGRGWDQNDWAEKAFPTHDLLSAASPNNPVYLTRVDGHARARQSNGDGDGRPLIICDGSAWWTDHARDRWPAVRGVD